MSQPMKGIWLGEPSSQDCCEHQLRMLCSSGVSYTLEGIFGWRLGLQKGGLNQDSSISDHSRSTEANSAPLAPCLSCPQAKILEHDDVSYLKKILGELAMVLDQIEAELEKRKLENEGGCQFWGRWVLESIQPTLSMMVPASFSLKISKDHLGG